MVDLHAPRWLFVQSFAEATSKSPELKPWSFLDLFLLLILVVLINASLARCVIVLRRSIGFESRDVDLFPYLYLIPRMLAPEWNFFAPDPGHHDTRLLFRWKTGADHITPWREPEHLKPVEGCLFHSFWNHRRYSIKLLVDLCSILGRDIWIVTQQVASREGEREVELGKTLQLTDGYLLCLRLAMVDASVASPTHVQFCVARSADSLQVPDVVMRSPWHRTN